MTDTLADRPLSDGPEHPALPPLPELLSPCGSVPALEAAIDGGADAVYLGGAFFNARLNARNFTDSELREGITEAHRRGVKVYVTLNTQIYDRELKDALKAAAAYCDMGADALIEADLGLARLLRRYLPELELHASTQMTGHNTAAARYFAGAGFSRMVAARELPQNELAKLCSASPIPIEVFIHGAHCVSCSGQCLFSAMVGGRSGNRGECAQPCRMAYSGSYPLSLKDMCLAGHITSLINCGAASLKIEGRMKAPDYVFAVTRTYRRLLDERRDAKPEEIEDLTRVFSRSGFTDGYFESRVGTQMLGVRRDEDKRTTHAEAQVRSGPREICTRELPPIVIRRLPSDIAEASCKAEVSDEGTAAHSVSAEFFAADQIPPGASKLFDIVCLPLGVYDPGKANGVTLPAVVFDSEWKETARRLRAAIAAGARHVFVSNYSQLEWVKALRAEFPHAAFHGSFRLNVFNSQTLAALEGLDDAVLSPELILPQVRDIVPRGKKRLLVYGRVPLMLTEIRPGVVLRDRTGATFPSRREGRRTVIFNSVPTYMADRAGEVSAVCGKLHFIFSDENAARAGEVVHAPT